MLHSAISRICQNTKRCRMRSGIGTATHFAKRSVHGSTAARRLIRTASSFAEKLMSPSRASPLARLSPQSRPCLARSNPNTNTRSPLAVSCFPNGSTNNRANSARVLKDASPMTHIITYQGRSFLRDVTVMSHREHRAALVFRMGAELLEQDAFRDKDDAIRVLRRSPSRYALVDVMILVDEAIYRAKQCLVAKAMELGEEPPLCVMIWNWRARG